MSTRQIKDAVNHSTGELVYFKSHAKATFMSDGKTVEEAINSIEVPSLDDYVTETELNDKGFLTEHQDISHLASRNWVESQGYAHQEDLLEISFNDIQDSPISIDDSGMINFVDESGNVGFQINEEGLRVTDVIAGEHKLSEKANASDIPSLDGYAKTEDIPSVDGFVKSEDLPNFDEFAKTNDIPSLDGYAKTEDVPSLDGYATEEWVNNKNYATEYELKTIDYSSINNVPVSEDETGELNIADENGNIGMRVASEAVYAKDFVAGEHKLSEKVDKTYVDSIKADNIYVTDFTIYDLLDVLDTGVSKSVDAMSLFAAIEANKIIIVPENDSNPLGGYVADATANESCYGLYINYSNTHIELTLSQHSSTEITPLDVYKVDMQEMLISGENIRTINGEDIIGDGSNMELATKDELNAKQDALISGTNIKTINGESLLGSGNITISSGGGGDSVIILRGDTPSVTLSINTTYIGLSSLVCLTVNGIEDFDGRYGECTIAFRSYFTGTTLTLPDEFLWANGTKPEIDGDTEYELSISVRKNIYSFPYYKAVLTPFKPVE